MLVALPLTTDHGSSAGLSQWFVKQMFTLELETQ